jgi:AcrR family transcriptional regulator
VAASWIAVVFRVYWQRTLHRSAEQEAAELSGGSGRGVQESRAPPEDRLCRQREIYLAVAPLLRRSGVRGLSMRAAARAAYVSVGGLYYYFPTKRDLALHGLQPEAIARYCHDKVGAFAHLAETDPAAFSTAILDHFHALVVGFVLPAYDAAVELGVETAHAQVHHTLEGSLSEARNLLWPLVPHLDEAGVVPLYNVARLDHAVSRTFAHKSTMIFRPRALCC